MTRIDRQRAPLATVEPVIIVGVCSLRQLPIEIGFAGLGQMGCPIAHNLSKSGCRLTVYSRSGRHLDEFAARGCATTQDPSDLGSADILFLCLPDADVVREMLFDANGKFAFGAKPRLVVDLSTIAYGAAREIAEQLRASGVAFLDAPVSGMESRARDATLTVMCGGDRSAFDTAKPYLDLIGKRILYMGPPGSGQLTKLVNQLLFNINMAALAEILPMAVKQGLDPVLVGEVVNSGTGRSHASEFFIGRILQDRFVDGYALEKAYKDLVGAAELSAKLCVPMPVLSAATITYQTALLQGHGASDKGAMIRVFEELLGVKYRDRTASATSEPEVDHVE